MNPPNTNRAEQEILAAFDRSPKTALALNELGEPSVLRSLAARMVELGWLRTVEAPDRFVRTEEGRLQLAGPLDVTIYSRPSCHLCEEAKTQLAPLLAEFAASLTEINIDEDPELRARYDYDVPVIFIASRKVAKHRVDLTQFRRQLRDAAGS